MADLVDAGLPGSPACSASNALEGALRSKHGYLGKTAVFRDLDPDEREVLQGVAHEVTMGKDQVIYRQGERAERLFLLREGQVRLSRLSPAGRERSVAVLEPGTFFGQMPPAGETMRNARAVAMDNCRLVVMSKGDFERLIAKKQVALRILEATAGRLAQAEARLEDLAYRSVPARLVSLLLRLAPEHDGVIEGLTHQDLGDAIGAYRETITKALDDFEARGLVEVARRRLRILDRAGLSRVLEDR